MRKLLLILLCVPLIGLGQKKGCIKGNCINGYGTYYYDEYQYYEGEWKDSLRHGQGTEVLLEGKYVGQWNSGSRDGKGICYYASPSGTYDGEWKNGRRDGKGTEIFSPPGSPVRITNGFWKEDKFIGEKK